MTQPTIQIPRETHLTHLRHTINLAQQSPPKPTNFRVGCVIVSYPAAINDNNKDPSTTTTSTGTILSTGYTLELPGNTHAEQCALAKLEDQQKDTAGNDDDDDISAAAAADYSSSLVVLYTSLEPCGKRLSGAQPCVHRILATRAPAATTTTTTKDLAIDLKQPHPQPQTKSKISKIHRVVFGAKEPGTFVTDSQSCRLMSDAGLPWEYLPDYEGEILRVAMEGHHHHKNTGEMGHNNNNKEGNKDVEGKEEQEEQGKQETNIDDISVEERRRQEALPRNPKKRMMEGPAPG